MRAACSTGSKAEPPFRSHVHAVRGHGHESSGRLRGRRVTTLLCKAQSPVSCHTRTLSRSDKVMRAEIGRRALMERLSILL